MRRRSPSYSPPPRRGYGGRGRSPPRGRYGVRRDAPCGLLVRNIPKNSRPEDLRIPFERFGRIRDVYLPKDYYTGEPRGFGFVQFLDPLDAADAKRYMDRQMFNGREITVVFAEENRKRPDEMRMKERSRGRSSYGGRRQSPYQGDSGSRSPRYRSPSPRGGRYSRSDGVASRRERYESASPPPRGRSRFSRSPDTHRRGRGHSPEDRSYSPPPKDGRAVSNDGQKGGSRYLSPDRRSYSPQPNEVQEVSPGPRPVDPRSPSHSPAYKRYSRSPQKNSRSRSKSWRDSRSPQSRSPSPAPRRKVSSSRRSRDSLEQPQKTYSSLTPEERSPRRDSESPGRSL